MYKLIACDLDETLLDEQKNVSSENRLAIQKAQQLGVKFVPTTGRGFATVQKTLQAISTFEKENEYVISYNGGIITENKNNHVIACSGITFEQAKIIFDIGTKYHVFIHVYSTTMCYVYNLPAAEENYLKGRIDGYKILEKPTINELKNEPLIKVLYGSLDFSLLKRIEKEIPEAIKSQYSISFSSNRYLEFNQVGINKGEGITRLGNKLNITLDEIIAIGDNNNDISMIQKAGLGVCVQNATDEVKQEADYICQANHNQSAIAEVINRFILKC